MQSIAHYGKRRFIVFRDLPVQLCPGCGRLMRRIALMGRHGHCDSCSPVTDNGKNTALLMPISEGQKRVKATTTHVTDNCACLVCRRTFYSVRKDARYCSPRCRQQARRERKGREAYHLLTSLPSMASWTD